MKNQNEKKAYPFWFKNGGEYLFHGLVVADKEEEIEKRIDEYKTIWAYEHEMNPQFLQSSSKIDFQEPFKIYNLDSGIYDFLSVRENRTKKLYTWY